MDKKQYNSIWAGSLALLLLAGSCSKSDETAAPEPADGRIVVRALASDSGQAPSFDRFGLYIVQKAAEGSEALAGERLHANVEFTRSGDTYVSTPAIAFPGAKKLRFDLYAYAPYRETALEAGADDLRDEGDVWEIQTAMADFNAVREAFEAAGLEMISAELNQVPQTTMEVDLETARKLLRFIELLEDNDDVQNVYSDADISDEIMAQLED